MAHNKDVFCILHQSAKVLRVDTRGDGGRACHGIDASAVRRYRFAIVNSGLVSTLLERDIKRIACGSFFVLKATVNGTNADGNGSAAVGGSFDLVDLFQNREILFLFIASLLP